MEQILKLLGFTDLISVLWNLSAYFGMTLIILAVISDKWRNQFLVWAPLILLPYAWFYLGNHILASLQIVVAVSAILNLVNVKKIAPFIVFVLTIIVYTVLLIAKHISGVWLWIGSFGFLGIALGLTQLPHKKGFIIMSLGALLIVVYAFALQIWVFFVLNLIFFVVNLLKLRKK